MRPGLGLLLHDLPCGPRWRRLGGCRRQRGRDRGDGQLATNNRRLWRGFWSRRGLGDRLGGGVRNRLPGREPRRRARLRRQRHPRRPGRDLHGGRRAGIGRMCRRLRGTSRRPHRSWRRARLGGRNRPRLAGLHGLRRRRRSRSGGRCWRARSRLGRRTLRHTAPRGLEGAVLNRNALDGDDQRGCRLHQKRDDHERPDQAARHTDS